MKLQTPNLTRLRLTEAKLKGFFVAVKLLVAHSQGQRHFQLCQPKPPEVEELPNSEEPNKDKPIPAELRAETKEVSTQ